MRERAGNGIRRGGNGLYKFEFPDPMLMTLDLTQSFWKNVWKMREKLRETLFFPHFGFWLKKTDQNSGLHAKNQRDIFKNKGRRPSHPLYGNVNIPLLLEADFWNFDHP